MKLQALLLITLLLLPSTLALTTTQEEDIGDAADGIDNDVIKEFLNELEDVDEDLIDDGMIELVEDMSENTMKDLTRLLKDIDDDRDDEDTIELLYLLDSGEVKKTLNLITGYDIWDEDKDRDQFTIDDAELLFYSYNEEIVNATRTHCTKQDVEEGKLSASLQTALSGAMSNIMDTKFRDQQDWMQQTALPSQEEKDELERKVSDCEVELNLRDGTIQIKDAELLFANKTMSQEQANAEERVNTAHKEKEWWMWTALLMVAIIFVSNIPFIRDVMRRRKA